MSHFSRSCHAVLAHNTGLSLCNFQMFLYLYVSNFIFYKCSCYIWQVKCKGPELQSTEKEHAVGIQGYAMRFMEYNSSQAQCNAVQAPMTHDVISDLAVMDHSWEDNLTEVWTHDVYLNT